jgi:hypothetical protein
LEDTLGWASVEKHFLRRRSQRVGGVPEGQVGAKNGVKDLRRSSV